MADTKFTQQISVYRDNLEKTYFKDNKISKKDFWKYARLSKAVDIVEWTISDSNKNLDDEDLDIIKTVIDDGYLSNIISDVADDDFIIPMWLSDDENYQYADETMELFNSYY